MSTYYLTMIQILKHVSFLLLLSLALPLSAQAQSGIPGAEAAGKWDITLDTPGGELPSWVEIEASGSQALLGQFVGPAGSARPISEINYDPESQVYSFSIPPQWVPQYPDPQFVFSLENDKLNGWTIDPNGNKLDWTAVRAPSLDREQEPNWGKQINLLDQNLSKWNIPDNNQFRMENGVLINREAGGNLITKEKFNDFKLHAEFRYPEGSNAGIYLRGRYEIQIADNYGMEPESHLIGGIYGFIDPTVNAAKKAGEWQTYDITLTGRMVTVVLNGTEVISNRPIPGITGGALNSDEGQPGPIMLQGDHGPVEFRKIIITPALN